jgi:hypothetical protein
LTKRRAITGRNVGVVEAVELKDGAIILVSEERAIAVRVPHTTAAVTGGDAHLTVRGGVELIVEDRGTIGRSHEGRLRNRDALVGRDAAVLIAAT